MSKTKVKSLESVTRRIIAMIESGDYDAERVEHMIGSLVKNRDKVIVVLKHKVLNPNTDMLKRYDMRTFTANNDRIGGALLDTIKTHGPITKQWISSAQKRIYTACIPQVQNDVEEPELGEDIDDLIAAADEEAKL